MNSDSFKNVIYKMFTNYIFNVYVYKCLQIIYLMYVGKDDLVFMVYQPL